MEMRNWAFHSHILLTSQYGHLAASKDSLQGQAVLTENPSSPMSLQSWPIPDTVILGFGDKVLHWLLTPAPLIILDHKVA